jgi:hypothetical protein
MVKNLWDESLEFFDLLAQGHWKAPALQQLQNDLMAMSPEQRIIVRQCVVKAMGTGLHQFLFALGEAHDCEQGIAVVVGDVDICEQSDGLHGEIFGPDGWMAKYSKHPEGYPDYKT